MKKLHEAAEEALGKGHDGHAKPKKGKGGPKPHEIHMKRGAKGGYIAVHHHKPGEDGQMPPEHMGEHPLPDKDAMLAHMDQHMGDQEPIPESGGGDVSEA